MPGKENFPADYGGLFDAQYYRTGFGGEPYERSKHWLEFFGGIADEIIRSLKPRNVFDAGCAWGFLVESFWDRGVESWGIDISEYGIAHVRPDMQPYCRVGSLTEPVDRRYDLITCIEVLEHMPAAEVDLAIANLCQATDRILFSSTPRDFDEPTHQTVRPVMAWLRAFQKHGFVPDVLFDASFFAPHGFLVRRQSAPLPEEMLLLFNEKVQGKVELVDKLQRLIQAAKDIHELRTTGEEAARDRDVWRHKAEELGYTVEEWISHNTELRREMRRTADAATLRQQELAERIEAALAELRSTQEQAVRRERELSRQLHERSEEAGRREQELSHQLHERSEEAGRREQELSQKVLNLSVALAEKEEDSRQLAALASRHAEVEQLARHIQQEYASPAWQLIKRYRNWMNTARSRHPFIRKYLEPAVVRTLRAVGAGPKPSNPSAGPGVAAAPGPIAQAAAPPSPAAPSYAWYADWIAANEPDTAGLAIQAEIAAAFSYRPKISIVVPVYQVPLSVVQEAVASIQDQTYDQWELCVVHAYPEALDVRQYLETAAQADPRIQLRLLTENQGISGNSNAALALATGEFIALLDHDDTLAPFALFEVAKALNDDPSIDFLYSDKDQLAEEAGSVRRVDPLFKPDWSPEILLSANYLTHLCVMRSEHVRAVGGWRPETDGAQDWDLFLRVTAHSRRIYHIPKVLYHWRRIATSVAARGFEAKPYAAAAQLRTLQDYNATRDWNVEVREADSSGMIRLDWNLDPEETISVILLTNSAGNEPLSEANALRELANGASVEVIIPVDRELSSDQPQIRPARVPAHSNLTQRITEAVRQTRGKYLVFVDQSVTPSGPEWLQQVTGPLQDPAVGMVGAKLVDARSETIRHAGLVFNENGGLQYIFSGQPEHYYEIFGGPGWFRNWSAVCGACFAIRRETWDAIGGLSGTIGYPRLDVELCLRVRWQLGLRIVYNPRARLLQRDSSAMEAWLTPDPEAAASRYIGASFPQGDPYFNLNLSCSQGGIRLGRSAKETTVLDYAAESRILVTAFDFTRAQLEESKRVCRSPGQNKLERITWFLPEFTNPFYGGVHTILRFASHFRERHAVHSTFVILGYAHQASMLRRMTEAFPSLADSELRVMDSDTFLQDLPASDAAVATLWTTAYSLLKFRNTRRKFYFIQDYEPLFYPAGSTSALVEETYDFGFTGICNTVSLKEIYAGRGGEAEYFDPCIDPTIFYRNGPPAGKRTPQLFCYARPGHPRNCFELLMEALKRLKQRMADQVSIVTAGADFHPAAYGVEGVIRNLGVLGYRETGALYRTCDAGLVAMKTRHPSYLPLELMACGAAVVTNRNPYTSWLLRDGENCVLAEMSPTALAESLEEVLQNPELRARLVEGGAACAGRYSDWATQAEKIYNFLVTQC